ncbi:MAG: hypothetical protein AAF990_01830 [Bacteroidota bacterium]
MKYFKLFIGLFLLPMSMAVAQNQLPKVSNVKVSIDKEKQLVQINYDVSDKEESQLTIALTVADDAQGRFMVDTKNATGDIGENVAVGSGKKITWKYSDSLRLDQAYFRIVADDGYKVPMEEILAKVDANRIKKNLATVSVARHHKDEKGRKNLVMIRSLIENTFQDAGYKTRRQIVPFGGWTGENILGRKAGLTNERSNYVVMADFDSVESREMSIVNSNGIVGVLEVMSVLGEYQFKKTLLGAGFDLIYPEHMGANFFIWKDSGMPKDEQIEAGFFLDGIASDTYRSADLPDEYKPKMSADWVRKDFDGTFMMAFVNNRSVSLLDNFRKQAALYSPETLLADRVVSRYGEEAYQSQAGAHAPFWYRDLKAIYVTTWMAIRHLKPNRKWSYPEAALKMSSIKTMSEIIKTVIASVVEEAEILHCDIFEAPLKDDSEMRAAVK